MNSDIRTYCEKRIQEFDAIPEQRKEVLKKIAAYVQQKRNTGNTAQLVFICTHNSRRSHFGQIWSAIAASWFHIDHVQTFSGGTEATAFHPNAIAALRRVGLRIEVSQPGQNPVYEIFFDDKVAPLTCFSKIYDDPSNPQEHFAAIMTCSDAEENCPFIPSVELRLATTYEDPKKSDGSDQQEFIYDERCQQIAREMLFVFSLIRNYPQA
jgi:protein-tyrosine-phosphatase